jgi:hypothetical protein
MLANNLWSAAVARYLAENENNFFGHWRSLINQQIAIRCCWPLYGASFIYMERPVTQR